MATKPSDPFISIEGMFNGCITRIAQAIKDPLNFGASTRGVLFECSKRYQDALDDCAIQILDAKFYLEHQLAQNRARREAKAREENAATAKRKHDQIKDTEEKEGTAKRVKVENTKPVSPEQLAKQPTPSKSPDIKIKKTEPKPEATAKPPTPKPAEPPKPASPKLPGKEAENPLDDPPPPSQPLDDFPKPTPNATPAPTNDDFNFESMFAEPSADAGAGSTDDLPFDLDLGVGDTFAATLDSTTDAHNQSQDLNSLLPGLESYANQAGDDGNDGNNVGSMSFDLPPLPNLGPNDFDAFLDANDFTAVGGGGGGAGAGLEMMNLNDDPMGNLEDMNNLDFDSMFNN